MLPILVEIWIIYSAFLTAGGWVLSWFHQFDATGFSLLLLAAFGFIFFCYRPGKIDWRSLARKEGNRFRWRIHHILPLLFYLLAAMSIAAGLLYRPMHIDAIGYRLPRLLHWGSEHQWHWISTPDIRMNAPAPGCEFLMAPILFLTGTERLLFYYNPISFLLLPGLLYSVFLKLGANRRVAWAWMWLLPAAYCYVMQASSLANDSYTTVYVLAAIDFALKARGGESKAKYLWLSILAIATASGAKQTNALFGLPWLIAFAPNWRAVLRRPLRSSAVAVLAVLASFVPISVLNTHYAGNWKGFASGYDLVPKSPVWGVIGNTVALTAQNFQPPACPWISKWNAAMASLRASPVGKHLDGFERFGDLMRTPSDQSAGLGFVFCMTILLSVIIALRQKPRFEPRRVSPYLAMIHVSFWLVLIMGMAKLGSTENARYLAPLYPLLLSTLLLPGGHAILVRSRRWLQWSAIGVISTVLVISVTRQRPLVPIVTVSNYLAAKFPRITAFQKVKNAYTFFPRIEAAQDYLARAIPPNEKKLGYAADLGVLEIPLWKPLWTKKVVRINRFADLKGLRDEGIRYVVLDPSVFHPVRYEGISTNWVTFENWCRQVPSEMVGSVEVPLDPQDPPLHCYIARLKE